MTRASETAFWIRNKGNEKTKGTALELWGFPVIRSIGYEPRDIPNGIFISKEAIARAGDWRPRNVEAIRKYPDCMVTVSDSERVILFDGFAVHNRTLMQDREKRRDESLYNAVGYFVIRVGEYWSTTQKRTEQLKPLLAAALVSGRNVDLAT